MKCKRACIVLNPRAGKNLEKLTAVLTVLWAAGWRTSIALKEYPGQTLELATRAAEDKYDLVIAYGGDGTLNQVVNGVMNAGGQRSVVGVFPGGTANVWAGEIGVPTDPVKAALTLYNSEACKVDVGHVEVPGLAFPPDVGVQSSAPLQRDSNKPRKKKTQASSGAKHHFLLMAGLGIDAAVMDRVSRPLKYRVGPLAVGVSAAKELPAQQPFPVEIRSGVPRDREVLWKGEAIQVVIGNTRSYANLVQMTPNAYIDDGILDVCVIMAGDPLTTMGLVASLVLRRKPDDVSGEYFHGIHLSITVPASVGMQLDGSAVQLKDYLSKADRQALAQADDPAHVMVTYRFDAMPRAMWVAIPCTYNGELFENLRHDKAAFHRHGEEVQAGTAHSAGAQVDTDEQAAQQNDQQSGQAHLEKLEQVKALLEQGRKVTVTGISPNPDRQHEYIVAGTTTKKSTGEARPVAVRVGGSVKVMNQAGEDIPLAAISKLQEGESLVVRGKKSKRGVIRAERLMI